jgi:hypothetical protein
VATKFQDMSEADRARLSMGANKPPLEETILMDFDSALLDHDGLIARIDAMAAKAAGAGPCTNADEAGRYGDFIKMTAAAVKTIEAEREVLNRPLLNAQRMLKARADGYSQKATRAGAIVRAKLDAYLAEVERLRRAEQARLAEIARAAEAERHRIIDEERRRVAAAAESERQRLQAIADEEARVERERLQAIENERAAREQREAAAVVVEAAVVEVEPEPVFVPEPEPEFVSAPVSRPTMRGDYGTTVSTTTTWHVEVQNIRQVPDQFLKSPAVIEAVQKVIGPLVRAKNGLREVKGCRIYPTTGSAIR